MEILDSEWKTLHTVARDSVRRYPMVEEDDVVQELAMWMLNHEEHILKWREDEKGYKARYRSLKRAARAYCEKEKAYHSKYSVDDVVYYSIEQIKKLLPLAFEGYTGVMGQTDEKVRSGGGDPATGGDLMAMVTDVRIALQGVELPVREVLFWATQYDFDHKALSEAWDEPYQRLRSRVRRALGAVQRELGGPNPHREFTGRREVLSNGQARAMLRNQVDR